MRHWFSDLPGVSETRPLSADLLRSWPDRAMDSRLSHLRYCPVLPQELYQVARHFPMVVIHQPGGPQVVAELDADRLRRPAFDAEGRFLRSYRPMATRLLPFCTTSSGELIRLTDDTAAPGPERPADLRGQLVQMLRAQAKGMARMSEAANLLIEEGLLAQASGLIGPDGQAATEWCPAPEDLAAETVAAAANLAALPASFLALRILAVLEFSAMHRRQTKAPRSDADSLRALLGRNEALQRQTFMIRDELLDFSGFVSPAPKEEPPEP